MNLEYLRHGKALCGKVFRRFVETFNFHNDFISNLKGDADLQVVGGKIHLNRTDERHPVISCQGCGGGGGGGGAPSALPWSFSCTEDPETHERTGGWTNGRIQVGYETRWGTPDVTPYEDFEVKDADTCDDGYHSIEVDLKEMTVRVVCNDWEFKSSEPEKGIIRFQLGWIHEGKLEFGVHVNPVCYHYL